MLYLVLAGGNSAGSYLIDQVLPVPVGNIAGGSALVALLNHATCATSCHRDRRYRGRRRR